MSLMNEIEKILRGIWDYIKKTFVRVVSFFRNIASWFRRSDRLRKLQEEKHNLGIVMRRHLDEGQFVVVSIFDKETNEIKEAEAIEYEELSDELESKFGDKDMLVVDMKG